MIYKIEMRRRWLWKTYRVVGHRYDKDLDRFGMYFEDGSLREFPQWSGRYEIRLGPDWVLAQKKMMEEKAGINVPVKPTLKGV